MKSRSVFAAVAGLVLGSIIGWVSHDVLVTSRQPTTQSSSGKTKGVAAVSPPVVSEKTSTRLEIIDIDAKVTESNNVWWKYAWRLTVQNLSSEPVSFRAKIEFLDKDGFVVDDVDEYGLYLENGQKKTFTGYDLITTSAASNIASVNAKVSR